MNNLIGRSTVTAKPVYLWGSKTNYYPSEVEKEIVEALLVRNRVSDCVRAVREKFGREIGVGAVRKRLGREHVSEYVKQRMEEMGVYEGWTRERWMVVMTRHLEANARYDVAKDEVKMYEAALARNIRDMDARVGLVRAMEEMRIARVGRLGVGDAYVMKLVADVKGFKMPDVTNLIQNVQITQANGEV